MYRLSSPFCSLDAAQSRKGALEKVWGNVMTTSVPKNDNTIESLFPCCSVEGSEQMKIPSLES